MLYLVLFCIFVLAVIKHNNKQKSVEILLFMTCVDVNILSCSKFPIEWICCDRSLSFPFGIRPMEHALLYFNKLNRRYFFISHQHVANAITLI